jgi:hypothetical protein
LIAIINTSLTIAFEQNSRKTGEDSDGGVVSTRKQNSFRKDAAMLSFSISYDPHLAAELDFRAYSLSHAKISALSIQHDELDAAIDALAAAGTHDDLTVARLKKRRLQIRDEIASLVAAARMREETARQAAADSETVPAPKPERRARRDFLYEGAVARYRALMVKSRDPARRRMLQDMIARELKRRGDRAGMLAQGAEAAAGRGA